MTRVSIFIQESQYRFEAWEDSSSNVKKVADDSVIIVHQGRNINYADIRIHCKKIGLTLTFSTYDLWQEGSAMLNSIRKSVVEDITDENFDYWDNLPPFGVIHLFQIELIRNSYISNEDLAIFFDLFSNFLLKYFMMYVFYESEAVSPYMIERAGDIKTFNHQGKRCCRVKQQG